MRFYYCPALESVHVELVCCLKDADFEPPLQARKPLP